VSVDALSATDQRLSRGPFAHVAPAPNGAALALLTPSGTLWVVSADFQRPLAELEIAPLGPSGEAVRQLVWCGNDAVLVTWQTAAVLVGPFGDTLTWGLLVRPRPG
jgi:hypothetical protein